MVTKPVARQTQNVLDRPGRQHSRLRKYLRRSIHFFSYHFILHSTKTKSTRVAGLRLTVHPTVFHPRFFLSSASFAKFVGGLDLSVVRLFGTTRQVI